MFLSVIIPVLNEGRKLTRQMRRLCPYLSSTFIDSEIIIVDDGSTDDAAENAKSFQDACDNVKIRILKNTSNMGKGYALRKGITASKGEYVCFLDCGDCVKNEYIRIGLEYTIKHGADIAHASRHLAKSKIVTGQSLRRRLASSVFRRYMRKKLNLPAFLTDTQCGFKIYKGDVGRKLYSQSKCNGFLIDIEIIIFALNQGYKIREFPIKWKCDRDSRLNLLKTLLLVKKEMKKLSALRVP
ncbi:MAG: glycosyltransferase [Sedimentisphaeraceae bacterium JB056]